MSGRICLDFISFIVESGVLDLFGGLYEVSVFPPVDPEFQHYSHLPVSVVSGSRAKYLEGGRVDLSLHRVPFSAFSLPQMMFKGGPKFFLNTWRNSLLTFSCFTTFCPCSLFMDLMCILVLEII